MAPSGPHGTTDPGEGSGERSAFTVTGDPEDRFRELFETLPVGIFQTRPDGTILEANPALASLLGAEDAGDLRGMDANAFYSDTSDRSAWQEELAKSGLVDGVQVRLRRMDGELVWAEMAVRQLEDDEGELFFEGTVVDISERRRTKRALEESVARFRSLLESAPDAMIIVDEEGRVRITNGSAEDLFGYDRDELTGMQVETLLPDRFREHHVAQREGYMEDPQRRPMGAGLDLYALTKEGEEVPVEISLSPAQMPGDDLVIAAVRDITEHKRLQETLRVLRTMPAEIEHASTPQEAIETALRTVCEATGWPLAEAWQPRQDGSLVNTHTWHAPGPILEAVAEGSGANPLEPGQGLPGRAVDRAQALWVEDVHVDADLAGAPGLEDAGLGSGVAIPVHGDEGVLCVLVFLLADRQEEDERFVEALDAVAAQLGTVIERKRVEQELRARTRELEAANEELKAFTRSVSHDLQTPLRTIEGFSHLLLDKHGDDVDEDGRFLVERMRGAGQTMADLIDSLRKLSRITRQEIEPEPVDLAELAREIVDELERQHPDRDVGVEIEDDLTVEGDPGLLHILMENLLSNAWKFTGDQPEARIEVGARVEDGQRVFFVRDNGAGFPEDQGRRIFEPFKRLHDEEEFEGTGIGLATAYRVVRRHGGIIEADGTPGEGAEIRFTIGSDGNPFDAG